jgi:hypothetical protein
VEAAREAENSSEAAEAAGVVENKSEAAEAAGVAEKAREERTRAARKGEEARAKFPRLGCPKGGRGYRRVDG